MALRLTPLSITTLNGVSVLSVAIEPDKLGAIMLSVVLLIGVAPI